MVRKECGQLYRFGKQLVQWSKRMELGQIREGMGHQVLSCW